MVLTNRPRSFHHTSLTGTDMSDCHKADGTYCHYLELSLNEWIPAKTIEYGNYSKSSPGGFSPQTRPHVL